MSRVINNGLPKVHRTFFYRSAAREQALCYTVVLLPEVVRACATAQPKVNRASALGLQEARRACAIALPDKVKACPITLPEVRACPMNLSEISKSFVVCLRM